jgi:hypothetical protein
MKIVFIYVLTVITIAIIFLVVAELPLFLVIQKGLLSKLHFNTNDSTFLGRLPVCDSIRIWKDAVSLFCRGHTKQQFWAINMGANRAIDDPEMWRSLRSADKSITKYRTNLIH